jgi:NodT family efflux transporter outer membrane factor (OMF) lipoprotein
MDGGEDVRILRVSLAFLALGASGCSFAPAPEPVAPVEALPAAFSEAEAQGDYEPYAWWNSFQDPILDRLVDSVLVANLDLAVAVARVEESRALLGVSTSDLFPSITGSAGAARQDNPLNAGFGAIIGAILAGGVPGDSTGGETPREEEGEGDSDRPSRSKVNSFDASVGLSYEIDFWGRARNDRGASLAELQASASDYQVAQLGVLAEAITTYFDVVDLRNRIGLTEEIVDVLEERESLSEVRYNRGLVSSFELYAVRQDRQAAQSSLPQLRSQLGDARRRMALVSGRHLVELDRILNGEPNPVSIMDPVPPGLPADLLWQRPDVRASASRLEAARLRVGARKAEMLPQITLSGTLGLQSATSEGLFDLSQWFSNLAVGLTQPLFQGGRLRANLDVAEARYAQELAVYGQVVLTAVGEAETALLRYREEQTRFQVLSEQLNQAESSVSLQAQRYRSGVGAYTDYLDALRILLTTQATLSGSARDVALSRLGVHRALGGGWADVPGEFGINQ